MRHVRCAATLFGLLGSLAAMPASALEVSLLTTDWNRDAYPQYQTAAASLVNTVDGHLRGAKTTATPGSSWILNIQSDASYDLQNATLRYQWLINDQGNYVGTYNGVAGLAYNVDPNAPYFGGLTTRWSFSGSEVIPNNQWLYTEFKFSQAGYDFSVSKTGYGDTDFLHGSKAGTPAWWAGLSNARLFMQLGDNYAANAYFEIAGITVTAVPEPQAAALLLAGLGWIAWRRRGAISGRRGD